MKKRDFILSIAVVLLFCQIISAQPDTTWTRTFGGSQWDSGHSVKQTSDCGFIITGWTESYSSSRDVILIKTDPAGKQEWLKTYGGSGYEEGLSVVVMPNGGYVIGGGTESYGAGGRDIYIIKTDALGNVEFEKTFGYSGHDVCSQLLVTNDGGLLITGTMTLTETGYKNLWLIKTDSAGNIKWSNTFGGNLDEWGLKSYQTKDGGFITAGQTKSYGQGNWDVFLVKTDSNGVALWENTFGGSANEYGNCVEQLPDGGYIVSGLTYSSGNGSGDIMLIRTDPNGNQIWQQTYGGDQQDGVYCLTQNQRGDGYIAIGWTNSYGAGNQDLWLIQVDRDGNLVWDKTYGGTSYDCGIFISKTVDGGYICSGWTMSFGHGHYDSWLLKIAPDGNINQWEVDISINAGEYNDSNNIAGVSFGATDGFDNGIDLPEPPPPAQNYVQLYFPHPDWDQAITNYSTDIRYPVSLLYYQIAYDFCVATDQANQSHTITVTPQNGIGFGDGLYLQDMASGQIVKLSSAQNTYTFTPTSAEIYDFILLVGRLSPVQEYQADYPAGWNMIALPLNPIQNSVSEMFGDDLNGPGYFYRYAGTCGYELAEDLEQGQGYWLGLLNGQTLDYVGDSLSATVSVNLHAGNNLIGNPFKYQISKSNLIFTRHDSTLTFENAVTKGWLSAALHYWDNQSGGVYTTTDNLGLGWGAWMYTLVDSIIMKIQPGATKSLTNGSDKLTGSSDWEVQFVLNSTWSVDNTSRLGSYGTAKDGFDAGLDYPEPPSSPAGKTLTGYFEHDDWSILGPKYDSDIRAISTGETHWHYTVYSTLQGSVTLDWTINNVPVNLSLELYDLTAEKRIDMRAKSEYIFNYQDVRTFEIIKSVKTNIATASTLPKEYNLAQNYPNPFNPMTTIQYQLPKSENVILSIYNLNGKMVKEIVAGRQEAGYYSLAVDFSDLSSGIYLYRLKAGDYIAFRKCMILK